MGCYLLRILIPAVISTLLLWEGVHCRAEGYKVEVPPSVTVEDGLCVHIPCKFFYPESNHDPRAKLHGLWFVEDKQGRSKVRLVATNKQERINEINAHIRNRFKVSWSQLHQRDCSLTIKDAEAADEGIYHFRIERGEGFSYSAAEEKVTVTVTERKLNVTVLRQLREGLRESILCKTERCPLLDVPKITWASTSNISVLEIYSNVNYYSIESRMDVIPTAEDHQQRVTCKVTYGEGSSRRATEKTFTLNIYYPPRRLWFSRQLIHANGYKTGWLNVSQVDARVGDSLVAHCKADANPPSTQTWVRTPRFLPVQQSTPNHELKLSHLNLNDNGEYVCQADNQEGSSKAVLNVKVEGSN